MDTNERLKSLEEKTEEHSKLLEMFGDYSAVMAKVEMDVQKVIEKVSEIEKRASKELKDVLNDLSEVSEAIESLKVNAKEIRKLRG